MLQRNASSALLLACWLCIGSSGVADEKDAEGFKPLLHGKDLSGWVLVNTPAETWQIQDGMLVCSGKPIGEIRTDRMYQNFILELEWRHMVAGGNAGIFVWADDITAKGVPFHRSVEVQVLENAYGQSSGHTTHGDIFPIHGAKMTPLNGRGGSRAFPTEERSLPSPQWNHYRIECQDGAISLAVNHKVVTQGKDASPRKGYICLESEGGVVHYRNLRIKELPDTPVDEEDVAVANRGFVSLYSGLDLRGWELPEDDKTHWHANDWILAFDGKTKSGSSVITTSRVFEQPDFIFDLRPIEGFVSLELRARSKESGVEISADDANWESLLKSRDWIRLEGSVADDKLTLNANGRKIVADLPLQSSKSPLHLRVSGAAELANLYGREKP